MNVFNTDYYTMILYMVSISICWYYMNPAIYQLSCHNPIPCLFLFFLIKLYITFHGEDHFVTLPGGKN